MALLAALAAIFASSAVSGPVPTQVTGATTFQASAPGSVVVRFAPPSNLVALRTAGIGIQRYVSVLSPGGYTAYSDPFIVDQNYNPCNSFLGTITAGSNVITGITTKNTHLATGMTLVDRYGYLPAANTVASIGTTTVTLTAGQNATGTDTYQRVGFNAGGSTATPWSQLNCKITHNGVPSGTYTASVYAINVNGAGSASSASNSWTSAGPGSYYFFCGPGTTAPASGGSTSGGNGVGLANGSIVGNHDFGASTIFAKYWVAPGTTSNNGLATAPTNLLGSALNVWECNGVSGSAGASQAYVCAFNPNFGGQQNGELQVAAFNKLTLSIQPQSSQPIGLVTGAPAKILTIDGVITGVSGSTLTDSTLNMAVNQVGGGTSSGAAIANVSINSGLKAVVSNTATSITGSATLTGYSVGDFYEISMGDIPHGQAISGVGNGSIPAGATGPTTMTQGAWNTYTIPTTAFDAPVDSVVTAFPIFSQDTCLKIAYTLPAPSGPANWYLAGVGFTQ